MQGKWGGRGGTRPRHASYWLTEGRSPIKGKDEGYAARQQPWRGMEGKWAVTHLSRHFELRLAALRSPQHPLELRMLVGQSHLHQQDQGRKGSMSACASKVALIAPGPEIHCTMHTMIKPLEGCDTVFTCWLITGERILQAVIIIAHDTYEVMERCHQPTQCEQNTLPHTCSLLAFISSTHSRPHAAARLPSVATASPSSEATPATDSRSLRAEADRPWRDADADGGDEEADTLPPLPDDDEEGVGEPLPLRPLALLPSAAAGRDKPTAPRISQSRAAENGGEAASCMGCAVDTRRIRPE